MEVVDIVCSEVTFLGEILVASELSISCVSNNKCHVPTVLFVDVDLSRFLNSPSPTNFSQLVRRGDQPPVTLASYWRHSHGPDNLGNLMAVLGPA